jgi:hypothetical protein
VIDNLQIIGRAPEFAWVRQPLRELGECLKRRFVRGSGDYICAADFTEVSFGSLRTLEISAIANQLVKSVFPADFGGGLSRFDLHPRVRMPHRRIQ